MSSPNRLKGYRTVSLIKQVLVSQGYIVTNLEKTGKFVKEKDLWGLWDLLALNGKVHLFIQAKTNIALGKKKLCKWTQSYILFAQEHGSEHVRYEIWVKYDRRPIIVLDCQSSEIRQECA